MPADDRHIQIIQAFNDYVSVRVVPIRNDKNWIGCPTGHLAAGVVTTIIVWPTYISRAS